MAAGFPEEARLRATRVRLIGFDVDGVLTDGSLYYTDEGIEIKAFNTLDGHGLKMLQRAGVAVAIITGRRSRCVELRARNLAIDHLFQGVDDKLEVMTALAYDLGLGLADSGYMGDDVVDLPVMTACAFSAAPRDAHRLVREYACFTSTCAGGRGAVREVCELILDAQGRLSEALAAYLPGERR